MRPQQTETQVIRFAKVIQQILLNFPEITTINPHPLTPQTYVARLRDAITAQLLHQYQIPAQTINMANLFEYREDLIVATPTDSYVRAGHKNHFKKSPTPIGEPTTDIIQLNERVSIAIDTTTPSTINAWCLLHHARQHTEPITFFNLTPECLEALQKASNAYDIAVITNNDGTYTLL